jgi:hypothetical protein
MIRALLTQDSTELLLLLLLAMKKQKSSLRQLLKAPTQAKATVHCRKTETVTILAQQQHEASARAAKQELRRYCLWQLWRVVVWLRACELAAPTIVEKNTHEMQKRSVSYRPSIAERMVNIHNGKSTPWYKVASS